MPQFLCWVPLCANALQAISQGFHCKWNLYEDVVRLSQPWYPSPWSLFNDDLSGLDPHVPNRVVPIANAQKRVSESLDKAYSSIFTWL